MISPFNSPVEVGLQTLVLLVEESPEGLDLSRLVLYNHALLHSADLGGPQSLLPPTPIRTGELGLKRSRIEAGLNLLAGVELVEIIPVADGIEFVAADSAHSFLRLLESDHVRDLRRYAKWVVRTFEGINDQDLRAKMGEVSSHWIEEFEVYEASRTK
ncbi:ABC-three component system middle component 2 [Corynebacterium faecium]|uniref:ABC-three component system middle component 2 n=1 Tax=Corynebacterium faecium TaxID=3016001 RepID=UPI0022B51FC5|nr:ABC-three component system middle component 2 [Corynebacterium faecium]